MSSRSVSPPLQPPLNDGSLKLSPVPEGNESINSSTPGLDENQLEEIHTNISAQIITEQMLIEIYNEKNSSIKSMGSHKEKSVEAPKTPSPEPRNKISNKLSLLDFCFNGFGFRR